MRPLCCALAVLLLGAGAGGSAPLPDEPEAGPTVLLVTWDTTRADHVGAYGASGDPTPVLDGLAASGLLCERAYAPAPITLVSHTTLLTGTWPHAHGVRDNGIYRVDGASTLLAEVLAGRGFRTGAFVGSFVLDRRFGLDQGFEHYGTPPVRRLGQPLRGAERPAEQVVDDALAWLTGVAREEPLFLWAHFFDPHFSYAPPEPFRSRFADDPYLGEIAFCDQQLGRLLEGLEAADRDGPRLLVVTADHGEALGQHGEATHGVFVYEEVVRVPLVVVGDGVPRGVRLAAPVGLTDVVPTVLEWLGLPPGAMPEARGPSLLAHHRGDVPEEQAGDERAIPVESFLPYHTHGWHPYQGLVWRGHKLVLGRGRELYDLAADPGEAVDLAGLQPRIAEALAQRLARLQQEDGALGWAVARDTGSVERGALGALGYLGARSGAPLLAGLPAGHEELPDARERLPLLRRRDEALYLLWKGRRLLGFEGLLAAPAQPPRSEAGARRQQEGRALLARAREALAALRAEDEQDPEFAQLLGLVEVTLGNDEAATALFEIQARFNPRSAEAHFNLAVCYERTGHPEWARAEMLKALTLEPRALMASFWMADWHARHGRPGEAAWWLGELLARIDEASATPVDEQDASEVAEALALHAELLRRAGETGQAVEPPPDWPAAVLVPEGDLRRAGDP